MPIIDYIPYLKIDERNNLLKLFYKIARSLEKNIRKVGLSFATDGGFTSEVSIPTIVFGPGNIENAHQLNEFISIDDMLIAYRILNEFISKV